MSHLVTVVACKFYKQESRCVLLLSVQGSFKTFFFFGGPCLLLINYISVKSALTEMHGFLLIAASCRFVKANHINRRDVSNYPWQTSLHFSCFKSHLWLHCELLASKWKLGLYRMLVSACWSKQQSSPDALWPNTSFWRSTSSTTSCSSQLAY